MSAQRIQSSCNKNRAEELGPDVWDYFVIPHFYDQLDIREATKPRVIEGGRGSGKTMLLRYFSYQSVFSERRVSIPASDLKFIGLYWKADTQFAKQMTGRGIEEADWVSAFQHHLALTIGFEIVKAVETIASSKCAEFNSADLEKLNLGALAAYSAEIPSTFSGLKRHLRFCSRQFEAWLNNPHTLPRPIFFPGRKFALAIIEEIREQALPFKQSIFSLFLDEYENLTDLQHRIINTDIKHCEMPLLIHVAMKKGSLSNRATLGNESINEVSDFRTRDLDKLLHDFSFELFAAEILFSRFAIAGVPDLPISLSLLKDPEKLQDRKTDEYSKAVRKAANQLLPGLTDRELAEYVWKDTVLKKRIESDIAMAVRSAKTDPRLFTKEVPAEAIIVTVSLLHRESQKPEEILDELQKLREGKENRYTGPTNWIHNNLIGSVLRIYSAAQRPCVVYSGFSTFISLSHGNIRHFLELCDRCLNQATDEQLKIGISIESQAEAARQASGSFLSEIRNFGEQGYALKNFVLSLGSLFTLAQARSSQSEPEINHFSLKGGTPFTSADSDFFREAIKWSVLFEERETKVKTEGSDIIDSDWVLNPIYAPFFRISYRKKRKLPLTLDEVRIMINGEFDSRTELIRKYKRNWSLDSDKDELPLFGFLSESANEA